MTVAFPRQSNQQGNRAIRLLPDAVAARIAAGEVIERPASVVKELVENALDAGASHIRIDMRGGGLGQIRVSDDGHGIPADELWLACQRHATSKLPVDLGPNDGLDQVLTLGFRGEALPSIATVAELSIVSMCLHDEVGHRLTVRASQIIQDEPAPRSPGTTVTVRDLFHNVPARLESSARPQTETRQISQVVRRLALAAPTVRFALFVERRLALQTSGTGDYVTALGELYGPAVATSAIALPLVEINGARITGVIAGPEVTRPGRNQVNLIVNARWVAPRGLLTAIEGAYRLVLPRGRHPVAALVIEVPPDRVDINIHPAKLDVRLRNETEIAARLGEVIRDALGTRPQPLTVPFTVGLPDLIRSAGIAEAPATYDDALIITPGLPPLRLIGQVHRRLLLLEGDRGLYLVDQHRAHERVLWERLAAAVDTIAEPRVLPDPIVVELRPRQAEAFARRLDDLTRLGFSVEAFGGRTFLLRAAPELPGLFPATDDDHGPLGGIGEPDDLLHELGSLGDLDDLEAGEGESWRDRLLVRLSCRGAVRRGRVLDRPTMCALIEALGQTQTPAVCPHGSPLLIHVDGDLLAKQFDWSL